MHHQASEQYDVQLLPGETPDSPNPDDMRHWVIVYRDLIGMIEAANGGPEDEPASLGAAPASGPCCLQRLHRRLDFWMRRLEQCDEQHPLRRST